ncbi:MAG: bifunctional molybdenum cofactor biosynthesis protein MoaC/MoaB [Planctomycetota bacterium]
MSDAKAGQAGGLSHVGPDGSRMVDVGEKPITERSAVAEAVVPVGEALAEVIRNGTGRKGDVLGVAQLAGIQAVKRTADVIPLCHPLPVDGVDVGVELDGERVVIRATVRTAWRTGVEMEALHAATIAALTVIDMGKSVQRGLSIERVRLLEKRGGRGGDYLVDDPPSDVGRATAGDACGYRVRDEPWPSLRVGVLTVSDRATAGAYDDRGGPAIVAWCEERIGQTVAERAVVADEVPAIEQAIVAWTDELDPPIDLIFTTGGTGIGPRDVTPEAVAGLIDRPHPGLAELARNVTGAANPKAYLSRGISGVRKASLIVCLPGSPSGAVEWLDAMAPVLPHALGTLGDAGQGSGGG